jgi:tetratricopeptide (TPR) repeat protein
MLAHHYLEALRLRRATGAEESAELTARGRAAARDAGDRALALGAYPAAARLYEAALELSPTDDDERPELLLAYGRSRVDDAGLEDEILLEATEGLLRTGNVEGAAEAQARLGGVWLNRGNQDRALEHLERGGELVADRGPSPAKAFVLQELGRALMMADQFDRAIELASDSLRLAETLDLAPVRSRNLNTLGVSRVVTGDPGGIADLERAMEIAAAVHSYEEASAAANLTWMTVVLGDLRRAAELHELSRDLARRIGVRGFIRWQEAEHAYHCLWEGRWDEALAAVDEYFRQIEETSMHYMEAMCLDVLSAILLARGRPAEALAKARRATELARPVKDPQLLNTALAFEAQAALAVGEPAAASVLADQLVEAWHATGIRQPYELSVTPWIFRELGRNDQLLRALDEEALGLTPWHEAARLIATGNLVGAADVFAEIGSVPDEAYARLKAAEAFVAAGDRAGADAQLSLALPVLAELGATSWTAEAEALLARTA